MMRGILSGFIVIAVFTFPVASMALFEKGDGKTQIYQGKTTSSLGTQFDECYFFHPDGTLELASDGLIGVWDYKNLGETKFRYQGTVNTLVTLGVSGVKTPLSLHGDEISELGHTFKTVQKRVKECSIAAQENAVSGNHHLPQ